MLKEVSLNGKARTFDCILGLTMLVISGQSSHTLYILKNRESLFQTHIFLVNFKGCLLY